LIKRIALGLAIAALAAPVAQARIDEGIQGQPNKTNELFKPIPHRWPISADEVVLKGIAYRTFVTDFPSSPAVSGADPGIVGTNPGLVATPSGYQAFVSDFPRLSRDQIRQEAERFRASGADVIDIGCTPGLAFPALADVVRELVDAGMRVSIDTFDVDEIRTAVRAGASVVLSVNQSNIEVVQELASDPVRWVAVPELGGSVDTLEPTIAKLEAWGVSYLVDPILEPIGMGFMASLERYANARRRWPDAEMLMGIGNLTELTAADSTGVNALLIAICQELGIRAVLTTEVIPWARDAVKEIDIARRLMHYAVTKRTVPKGIDDRLVTVKDPEVLTYSEADLRALQAAITDPNYRIFADRDAITVFNSERFVRGTDIQEIFDQLEVDEPNHAFYLGKELAKASLAVSLGKTYRQEGTLSWGYLTPAEERSRHVRLTHAERKRSSRADR